MNAWWVRETLVSVGALVALYGLVVLTMKHC
jgi:hypothetical protein